MQPWGAPLLLFLLLSLGCKSSQAFLPATFNLVRQAQAKPLPPSRSRGLITQRWVETSVSVDIPASAEDAYGLYSDLEKHPRWSPWLRSVNMVDEVKRESTWTLESKGITVSWKAVNTIEEPPKRIQWESLTGLPNKGLVTFHEVEPSRTKVSLTISYSVPRPIAKLATNVKFVEDFIKSTLIEDLKRFEGVLLNDLGRQ